MPTRNPAITLAVACLLVGALAWPASAVSSAADSGAATACSDPVAHDPYDGYHVGVPAGWSVFRVDGRLVVTPSGTSPEQAVVAPVVLTGDLTAEKFFASSMRLLDRQIDAIGNAMSYQITSTSGGIPQASLKGRAGHVAVAGHATVLLLPDRTAHGSQLAVLSAYWAPPAQLAADQPRLASVAFCYGPERAPLFRIFKDTAFTYAMPPNFKVTSEGQDEILIAEGNDASASFLLTLLPASDGVTSVQQLQQYVFSHENIRVTHLLASSVSPQQSSSDGAVNQLENIEFTGVLNGSTLVHGLASVEASVLTGVDAAGTIRLALTKTSYWNSTGGAVIRIAAGIQHSFTQDLQEWERLSEQQQQFGQQVTGFDQALNGEDLVQDPATGQTFEAPYDSYLQSGPDGPGYYTGSAGDLQKLQIITP
jgi:hypothetical protein